MMKRKVPDMQKNQWNYKYSIVLFLVAFIISIIGIAGYPEYLFRTTPEAAFSVFSKAFVKGCIQSFLMWIYVTVLLHVAVWLLRPVMCEIKENIASVRNGEVTVRSWMAALVGAVLVVVFSMVMELFWGYLIIGESTGIGKYFNPYRFLFFTCVAFNIYVIILYSYRLINTFERLFFILVLTVGLCYSFGLPSSMISWDESIHYQRTVDASHLTRTGYTEAELDMMLMQVPVSYSILEIDSMNEELSAKTAVGMENEYSYRSYLNKNISYIPAGVVTGLCKLLNLGFAFTFCMGRYTNLVFYAVLVYFAMKRLKSGKAILAVIAAFPLNVFLASVYSYDFYLTALCMLGFSYLVGELQRPEEQITIKNAVIMISSLFVGIGTKAIYFPLLLLCLLLPASKFSSQKAYKIFRLVVCATTIITIMSFALPLLVNTAGGGGGGDVRGGENISVSGQIQYILQHPFVYANTLLKYLFGKYMDFSHAAGYTCHFAFLGFSNYAISVMMLLSVACFVDRDFEDEQVLKPRFRIVTLGLSFVTIVLVATSMYLTFTDVGLDTINGCQSRYLEPLIFPVAYCIGTGKIRFTGNERVKNTMFAVGSMSILYASVWEMCISKYN